ncbi:MAG: histidine triad nucleotide-binding protein [Gammaproteobacteria bacterium]
MSNCLFCKIADNEIDSDIVYEDDFVVAFNDINPQAPHHILIIPRKHIATINDIDDAESDLLGRLYLAARNIAVQRGVAADGYRVVMNCNRDAGQTVFHLHLHFLAGRPLHWPPG